MQRVQIMGGMVRNIAEVAENNVPDWMQDWVEYAEGMVVGKPWPRNEAAETAEAAQARRQAILVELELLDKAAVRPLRAVAAGTATPEDADMIAQIESDALALRDELAGLGGDSDGK